MPIVVALGLRPVSGLFRTRLPLAPAAALLFLPKAERKILCGACTVCFQISRNLETMHD